MQITVEPLAREHLDEAERVFRDAFGTFLGLPDPQAFTGDCAYTRTRWETDPGAAWAAFVDGRFAGSNFATRWGSFAFFGPLSVRPDLWDRGVAHHLLAATMTRFEDWQVAHAGLYTFAQSPKHIGLYRRYGFHPRFLTMLMAKPVQDGGAPAPAARLSALTGAERDAALAECRVVTDALLPGLDLTREIAAVQAQALGDTLLLRDDHGALTGFAVCHAGPGTEAGSGTCYVKFAAAAPGAAAARRFAALVELCERFAALRGASELVAGVNTAREGAWRTLLDHGFRTQVQGVAMQRPNTPGLNQPDAWVIDDWR